MTEEPSTKHHHRRSIRLSGYDYSAEGGYYITIVTQSRVCLFGEVIDGIVQLNKFGKIVWEEWFNTAKLREHVELSEDEFIVMPNHIHCIIWIEDVTGRGAARCAPTGGQYGVMTPNSLPTIVRAFKSAVTKRINTFRNSPGALFLFIQFTG